MRLGAFILFSCAILGDVVYGAEVAARVEQVQESRHKIFAKDLNYVASNGVDLKIVFEGPAIKGATSYGNWKIIEAVDDAGTDIKKPAEMGSTLPPSLREKLKSQKNEFDKVQHFFTKDKAGDTARVELKLGTPARKATKISKVKGEVQLQCGGDRKVVKVSKLLSLNGKTIEDPQFKAAGLVAKITANKQTNELEVEYSGNLDALAEMGFDEPSIVNAKGERASNGNSGGTFDGKTNMTYNLSMPLDDSLVLQIPVITGQKIVTVPFELKDIELP